MRAGLRNRLLTIESFSTSTNSFGEEEKTWSTFAQAWANVTVKSVAESSQTDQVVTFRSYLLTIPYRSDLTTDMRVILDDGQTLLIEGTWDPTGKRKDLVIQALEVNS